MWRRRKREYCCTRTAKVFPQRRYGKTETGNGDSDYGVGAGDVVVVVVVSVAGGEVAGFVAGAPAAGDIVVVVSVCVWVAPAAGEGFTIVVFVVAGLGDVAVVVVVEVGATSVRCSHAARSAAHARMQMDFFIGLVGLACWD